MQPRLLELLPVLRAQHQRSEALAQGLRDRERDNREGRRELPAANVAEFKK